jgi:molecular chaperone DnaK
MSQERVFGIDLGTTYSCISYVDDTGRPVVVPNFEGDYTTPSVVYFESLENITVGKEAKNLSKLFPDQVAAFIKQHIGKDDYRFRVHGRDFRAEEISALVLKKVVQDAEQTVGKITDVVITVPAYFGTAEREATRQAGIIAGLNVRDIIPEPTAAAICYGVQQTTEQTVLVYDLGGGTFDVTVIRIHDRHIEVVCTNGNHELGGKDWDQKLVQYLAGEFEQQHPSAGDPLDDSTSMQELVIAAEDAKKALSAKEKDARPISHAGQRARVEITREQFEQITAELLEQTIAITNTVKADAMSRGVRSIDKVLLVGGSSKMPVVKRRLREVLGVEPELFEPDQSVAKGAALYAMSVQIQAMIDEALVNAGVDPSGPASTTAIEEATKEAAKTLGLTTAAVTERATVTNVSAKGYGVVVHDPGSRTDSVAYVLPSQSKLPAEHTETFCTIVDNQTSVNVLVMEQAGNIESPRVEDNREIATGKIDGIPTGLPANSPLEVTFRLDTDGTLHVTATEPQSRKVLRLQTKVAGVMSDAEVASSRSAIARAKVA